MSTDSETPLEQLGLDDLEARTLLLQTALYSGLLLVGVGLGVVVYATALQSTLCVDAASAVYETRPCQTTIMTEARQWAMPATAGGGLLLTASVAIEELEWFK